MNWKYLSILVCIVLLVVTVSACAESDFPTGRYIVEGGLFSFEFTEDSEVLKYQDGSLDTQGIYSVKGDEFTWKSDSFCGDTKATYIWTHENGALTFTVKGEDTCAARVFFFDNRTFYKE